MIERIGSHNAALLDNVHEDVFDHKVRREYLDAFLANPSNLLLVALVDGAVVGMASGILYTHPDKPLQLFVNEVGVADPFQRLGIGSQLVEGILNHAKAAGCAEAWVATEETNATARAFYTSLPGKEDKEKAIVYTWPLERGDQ